MARPVEHDLVRELLFDHWVPFVAGALRDSGGYPAKSIEYDLMRFGGEAPGRGQPPEWPDEATVIEREVVRLRRELRDVVLVEFGIVRDAEGYRLKYADRCKALHISRAKYQALLAAALDVLWHSDGVRELCSENRR